MAIEVQIPTILRTYTGGDKIVSADGATLADLVADLDAKFPGLRDRVVDDAGLRRFVNVYINDEAVRFIGGLEAELRDGDQGVVLPAVAGGRPGSGRAFTRDRLTFFLGELLLALHGRAVYTRRASLCSRNELQ